MCRLMPMKLILWGVYMASQSFVAFNLCLLYYHLNDMDKGFACGEFTTDSMVRGHHVDRCVDILENI